MKTTFGWFFCLHPALHWRRPAESGTSFQPFAGEKRGLGLSSKILCRGMKNKKVTAFDIIRPDKMLAAGLKTLGSLGGNLVGAGYAKQRTTAKEKSETAFIGRKKLEAVAFQLFEYDEHAYDENNSLENFAFFDQLNSNKFYWLNFHGLHEVGLYQDLAKKISLDRLTLRQMLDTTQRPKVEEYDHYLFFSVKSILEAADDLSVEQISFILATNYVISLQEEVGDHFDHIRNKIRDKLGLIRYRQSDYLLVQLLDAVLDNYFETIDAINLKVAELENICLTHPSQATLLLLERYKKDSQTIRKALMPFREALSHILNDRAAFIRKENKKYFQDLLNSCTNAVEEIESTSKTLEGLTNIYFASLSQKMNETMRVLTTVATIFIPLTFIVGVYV